MKLTANIPGDLHSVCIRLSVFFRSLLVLLFLLGSWGKIALPDDVVETDDYETRLERLERDNLHLRQELETLRQGLQSKDDDSIGMINEFEPDNYIDTTVLPPLPAVVGQPQSYFEQNYTLLLEGFSLHAGVYQVVPYGIGWLNVDYDTSRTFTGPFVLYVESSDLQNESSFVVNSRST